MKIKQIAQRLGVQVNDMELEFGRPCQKCVKLGGTAPECPSCAPYLFVVMGEESNDKKS